MITIKGNYFDGKTSKSQAAELSVDDHGEVQLTTEAHASSLQLSQLNPSPRVGNTPRYIYFPGGEKFETRDNDAVDYVLKRHNIKSRSQLLHILEEKKRYVLVTLIIVIISIGSMVYYGIPYLAREAAFALPAKTQTLIGNETLRILDKSVFSESELRKRTRNRLSRKFNNMVKSLPLDIEYTLLFRKGNALGANALALPSGTIIMTDELVKLAKKDNELISVLAHEIGHVQYRHGLRRAIQGSVVALLVTVFTGDTFSASTMIAALPTILIETSYSRQFEKEADQYSLDYMLDNDIDTDHFVQLMTRLTAQRKGSGKIPDFLSTHPSTLKRVEMFKRHSNSRK